MCSPNVRTGPHPDLCYIKVTRNRPSYHTHHRSHTGPHHRLSALAAAATNPLSRARPALRVLILRNCGSGAAGARAVLVAVVAHSLPLTIDIAGNEGAPLSVIHEIALHAALVRAQRPTLPRSPTSASLDAPRRRRSRSGSRTPKGLSRSLSQAQTEPSPRLLISGSRTPRSVRRLLVDP